MRNGKTIQEQSRSHYTVCVYVLVCVSSFTHDLICIYYDHFS